MISELQASSMAKAMQIVQTCSSPDLPGMDKPRNVKRRAVPIAESKLKALY